MVLWGHETALDGARPAQPLFFVFGTYLSASPCVSFGQPVRPGSPLAPHTPMLQIWILLLSWMQRWEQKFRQRRRVARRNRRLARRNQCLL